MYIEALRWLNYTDDKIEGLYLKTEHYSMQRGIEVFRAKGKELAMKEMKKPYYQEQLLPRRSVR